MMPTDQPVKLVGFEYKTVDCGTYQGLAALQLLFTNGVKTPVFTT
jgi:hypothetical protein